MDNKPETPKTDSPKAGSEKSEPVKTTGAAKTEPPKTGASAPAAAKPATGPGSTGGGRVPPTPPASGGNGGGRSSKMPLIVGGVALVLALGIGMNAASNANKAQDMVNATNDRLSTALRELNQLQERTQALPDTISRLEREVRDELAQALEKARNDVAGIEQRQARRLETLEEGLTALQDDSARPHREWQVAEVRYLMRIADHRLSLMDDAQGALAALNAADEMLKAIGDPRFGEVRDAIALEKQALENYDGTQVSQLVAELEQITAELKPMPLKMPEAENGAARLLMVNGEPAEDAAWWERAYFQVMNELNQHVTVRRHAQPVRSMPDADAELFMRQVLALRIESARLAALRLDAEDYRANLKGAQELLVEYFASEPVAPLLKRLQDLEQRELRAERPDISGSLEKLSGLEG
ncbi:uroporphyrinogen-III C-methyltransferase [Ectothiorhodospira shaposhnikovii]|uniref:uroporphyrinogen-III C-methyltransferase n=1 Tax=Ectothiorhodospira shaposhnikovii TaxID=1054 RepID=UPI001EE8C907|nr:uroporphyrinogen-III C-methyltransferase [Ectothiorhodospira shaposhnikovii]